MYVKLRRPDSICATALEFLVMNSPYEPIHLDGSAKTLGILPEACRFVSMLALLAAQGVGILSSQWETNETQLVPAKRRS